MMAAGPLRAQLLLARVRRPAQARTQDGHDPAWRQVAQVRARPGRLDHRRLPALPREKIFAAVIDDVEVKRVASSPRATSSTTIPEFRRVEETIGFLDRSTAARSTGGDVTVVRFSQIVEPRRPASATAKRRRGTELGAHGRATASSPPGCSRPSASASGMRSTTRRRGPRGGAGWRTSSSSSRATKAASARTRALTWRSKLPYDLVFEATTRVERPRLLEGDAIRRARRHRALAPLRAGRRHRGGLRVERGHDEALDERAWPRSPRPVFEWNHDWVMRNGGTGIADLLGCNCSRRTDLSLNG